MTQAFKLILSGVFALSGIPAYADGTPVPVKKPSQLACGQELLTQCDRAGQEINAEHEAALESVRSSTAGKMNAGAVGLRDSSSAAAAAYTGVAEKCRGLMRQCRPSCSKSFQAARAATEAVKCEDALKSRAETMEANASSLTGTALDAGKTADATGGDVNEGPVKPGGSGGGMGMLGTAALAAGAGLLGYMLGKNKSDKKNDDDQDEDKALQANGTLNCSKEDAYEYMDCNPYLSQACSAKMLNNTYAADQSCQKFASRFCGTGTDSAATVTQVSNDGSPVKGAVGEGLSQNPGFCQSVLAFNYCQGGGRTQCPSCLQLAANQAPACINNPALCLAQNSADQLNQAKNTCPTDPIFANPDMLKTGSQVATEIAGGTPLPVVTLPGGTSPSQVASTAGGTKTAATGGAASTQVAANTGGSTNGSTNGTVVTFSTASVNGGAAREGAGGGVNSQAAYGGGTGGGRGVNPVGYGSQGTGGREIASAGGGAMRPSSLGPASDVQGQFGPSVFAMGTQVLRQRCQAGKLNNCP